jgi:hypothetical protein
MKIAGGITEKTRIVNRICGILLFCRGLKEVRYRARTLRAASKTANGRYKNLYPQYHNTMKIARK